MTEDQLNQEDAGRKIGIVMVKKEHIKSLQVKQNVILANCFMKFKLYLGSPLKTGGSNLFSRQHIFDHRFLICMFENPKIIFQTKFFFSNLTLGEVLNSEFWYFYRKVAAVFDAQGSNSFFFLES